MDFAFKHQCYHNSLYVENCNKRICQFCLLSLNVVHLVDSDVNMRWQVWWPVILVILVCGKWWPVIPVILWKLEGFDEQLNGHLLPTRTNIKTTQAQLEPTSEQY